MLTLLGNGSILPFLFYQNLLPKFSGILFINSNTILFHLISILPFVLILSGLMQENSRKHWSEEWQFCQMGYGWNGSNVQHRYTLCKQFKVLGYAISFRLTVLRQCFRNKKKLYLIQGYGEYSMQKRLIHTSGVFKTLLIICGGALLMKIVNCFRSLTNFAKNLLHRWMTRP